MSTNPILSTEALTRRFGMFLAVDDLTLSVQPGEVLALLGRNGAGKSTAIKMLATLLAPTSGTAQVGGFDIVREPDAVRRVIGYVPQALSADGVPTTHYLGEVARLCHRVAIMRRGRLAGGHWRH